MCFTLLRTYIMYGLKTKIKGRDVALFIISQQRKYIMSHEEILILSINMVLRNVSNVIVQVFFFFFFAPLVKIVEFPRIFT